MFTKTHMLLLLSYALAMTGCDCHDAPGQDPDPDGGVTTDAGPIEPPWPSLMAAEGGGLVPPDLDCLGRERAPVAGRSVETSSPVVPFGAPPSVTLPGVPARFFLEDRASETCAAPGCVATLTDDAGVATAMLPDGAWVTTEVPELNGPDPMRSFMRTLEMHWKVGAEDTINTLNRGTIAGFEAQLERSLDPARGIAAGRVLDCQGRALSEARLRYFAADGAEITDATLVYFDGTLPPGLDPSAEATSSDGRYAGLDVPPTATRVEAWGSLDGSAPSPIACEPLQVEPDTLTVLVLRPTRADAPPACARR